MYFHDSKQQLLLQSSVSHDPSEIFLRCWFAAVVMINTYLFVYIFVYIQCAGVRVFVTYEDKIV